MRVSEGTPYPLGATWDGRGTNFALFSANAERVELCLFDHDGKHELHRVQLPERTEDIWHGYIDDVTPGTLYGYRCYGPYAPEHGHRFNHHKLLLDPYAKRLAGRLVWSDTLFGYRYGSSKGDLSFDRRDSARAMPKAVVIDAIAHAPNEAQRPHIPWRDTVIYEAHVKGLTQARLDVPAELRGSYRALACPAMLAHYRKLGVTSIELLPIHAFIDDRRLVDLGLRNYWGYNTLAFFAPEIRYAQTNAIDELRMTIARLHDAGFEVILDVVYNHTAEGDHLGPTLSMRGIDNASYYWLQPDNLRIYENFTGTGNSVNVTHPRVLQLVMDSLRYWVREFQIDGFRFDLAPTLARTRSGFDVDAPFMHALRQDPILADVKLIAEPWDIGLGGYQTGNFSSQWSEWNDVYRGTLRRFWRGDDNQIGAVSARMTGSADLFDRHGRKPHASINHVTVHDGFPLRDIFTYTAKNNFANGEDNRDGTDDNQSTSFGVEGSTDDEAINLRRLRAMKNQLASLFLARGTPLLLAGDEVGNSQGGNNNSYCQDNETGWVDWSTLGDTRWDLTGFIGKLSAMRKGCSQLTSQTWLKGRDGSADEDILWLSPSAHEMSRVDWEADKAHSLAYILAGETPNAEPLFIILNAATFPVQYTMPAYASCVAWSLLLDTSETMMPDFSCAPGDTFKMPQEAVIAFTGATALDDN